jgi:H+-transporting ATPase
MVASPASSFFIEKYAKAAKARPRRAQTGTSWERPFPSFTLFGTAEITQIGATLIAIYGILMTPIGWSFALIIWAYALMSFLINDQIKEWLFRIIHLYS